MNNFIIRGLVAALFVLLGISHTQAQGDTLCNELENRAIVGEAYIVYGGGTNAYNSFNRSDYTVGQAMVSKTNLLSQDYQVAFGRWTPWLLPPQPPLLLASQGDFKDRVKLSWEVNPLSPSPQSFIIYRDGSFLAEVDRNVSQYLDLNVQPGEYYNYSIESKSPFGVGSPSNYVGFVNPNGVVTGRVTTRAGNAVPDVAVRLNQETGTSLNFNGTSDQLCISHNDKFMISAFTISMYVKFIEASPNSGLIDRGSKINSNFWISTTPNGYGYSLHIGDGSQSQTIEYALPTINDNHLQWHQVSMVYNGKNMSLLVDGEFIDSSPATMHLVENLINIGSLNGAQGYFKGLIDDVRFYNRALSLTEIYSTKNRSISASEPGLVAYWKMDEGKGQKVFDLSNEPVNAEIYGAVFDESIPKVYNSGISDEFGYYVIDGINYSKTQTFTATPIKQFDFNNALEFSAVEQSYADLGGFDIPDTCTLEFRFLPFDNVSYQVLAAKSPYFKAFIENNELNISVAGVTLNVGNFVPKSYNHVAVRFQKTNGMAEVFLNGENVGTIDYTPSGIWGNLPWLLGTDDVSATTGFYTGLIDDFAIYNVYLDQATIQDHQVTGIPQDSTVSLLTTYFDFNEGTGTEAFDYAFLNLGGQLPRVGNLYHIQWTNYVQHPQSEPHVFEPNSRIVNLNNSNTSVGNIDFTDVSQVNISGFVRFENTLCFEDSVEILVNSNSAFPPIYTDKNGKFSADFEPGTNVTLSAEYKDHVFGPTFLEFRKLRSPKAGILFLDKTKREILVNVYGGDCQKSIIGEGDSVLVKVRSLDGCFVKTQYLKSGKFLTIKDLPARALNVSIEYLSGSRTEISDYFRDKAIDIDLRDKQKDTLDFKYTAPPQVSITGLSDQGTAECDIVKLNQRIPTGINIQVFEDYVGGKCYLNDAELIIRDQISGVNKIDTMSSEVYRYNFVPINVNLVAPYTNQITVTSDRPSGTSTVSKEAVVLGTKSRGTTFTSTSPEQPEFILRDPPGDKSYATLEVGSKICDNYEYSITGGLSSEFTGKAVLGGVWSFGSGFYNMESRAIVKMGGGFQNDSTFQSNAYVENCFTTTRKISTSPEEPYVGEMGGDVYVGVSYSVEYGLTDELTFDADSCKFKSQTRIAIHEDKPLTENVYSEYHLIHDVIPALEQLGSEPSNPNKRIDSLSAINWRDYIALNKQDRTVLIKSLAFDAGSIYEESVTVENNTSNATTLSEVKNTDFYIDADLLGPGLGFESTFIKRSHKQKDTTISNDTTSYLIISYHLEDDDPGDNFLIDVFEGEIWDTPIFVLRSGESMCPWELGTMKREGLDLILNKSSIVNVPANTPATFEATVLNTSNAGQAMVYSLREVDGVNQGAQISFLGNFENVLIEPNEAYKTLMNVERGPDKYNYQGLKIAAYSQCQYDRSILLKHAPDLVETRPRVYESSPFYKEVTFDAGFVEPCSPVDIRSPQQDWVLTPEANNKLVIVADEYNPEDVDLKVIKFQYRPVGGDGIWTGITELSRGNLNPSATPIIWNTELLKDGQYEIRAVAECFNTNLEPGVSTILRGRLERIPPIMVGTPEPGDGTWDPGDEISITFNEDLNCSAIIAADMLSNNTIGLYDATQDVLVDATYTCAGNKIFIVPNINPADFENRTFRVSLSGQDFDNSQREGNPNHISVGLKDKAGNTIPKSINWEFAVNQNNLQWVGTEIIETNTENNPFSVKRQIINRGGTIASFSMQNVPSWITVSPASGTLSAGQVADITITFQQDLLIGNYLDTLQLSGSKGREPMLIDYRVRCQAPSWAVADLNNYESTMNMVVDLDIFGVPSADPSDYIIASIGGEVRGVGQISYYRNIDKWLAYITIYGNADDQNAQIDMSVWDGDKCIRYAEISEQFSFSEGQLLGTPIAPLTIHVLNLIKQNYALKKGWNWLSFNLDLGENQNSVTNVLASLKNKNGVLIKDDELFAKYYGEPINAWANSLKDILPEKRYMIKLPAADSIRIKGQPYKAIDHPITIKQGWNWIGYIPNSGISVSQAFRNLQPLNGDIIKSQTAFAQYVAGIGWIGNLNFLEPGKGYLLKISNPGTLTYAFPAASSNARMVLSTAIAQSEPSFDYTKYPSTMNIIGQINGISVSEDDELRAYIDGELVGANKPIQTDGVELFFLTVYHQDKLNMIFKVFKADRKKEYSLSKNLIFASDETAGHVQNPEIFTLESAFANDISVNLADLEIKEPDTIFEQVNIPSGLQPSDTQCSTFAFNTILPSGNEVPPVCEISETFEGNMTGVMKVVFNERSTFVRTSDKLMFIDPISGNTVGCGVFDDAFGLFNCTIGGAASTALQTLNVRYYSAFMQKTFEVKNALNYQNNLELGDIFTPFVIDISPLKVTISNEGILQATLNQPDWIGEYCIQAFAMNCTGFNDGQGNMCFRRFDINHCVELIQRSATENENSTIKAVRISSDAKVEQGVRLEYSGGGSIELNPGFYSPSGTVFIGTVGGCSNN